MKTRKTTRKIRIKMNSITSRNIKKTIKENKEEKTRQTKT